jgi:hypothetical protein
MATRKVSVRLTRTYSKTTTVEIDVDVNIKDEELREFLCLNQELDAELEDGLGEASLDGGDDEYEYSDPTNNDGGHL